MLSTGTLQEILNLFTDLGLTSYIGIGVVIGATVYLFRRMWKAGEYGSSEPLDGETKRERWERLGMDEWNNDDDFDY